MEYSLLILCNKDGHRFQFNRVKTHRIEIIFSTPSSCRRNMQNLCRNSADYGDDLEQEITKSHDANSLIRVTNNEDG